jgi:hypothetical protein
VLQSNSSVPKASANKQYNRKKERRYLGILAKEAILVSNLDAKERIGVLLLNVEVLLLQRRVDTLLRATTASGFRWRWS